MTWADKAAKLALGQFPTREVRMDTEIVDGNGVTIRVGTRVIVGEDYGRVEQISDPDGDVDDEGRSVYFPPRLTVRFDSGDEDVFMAHTSMMGPWDEDVTHTCEDVEVDTRMLPCLTNCDPGDETVAA